MKKPPKVWRAPVWLANLKQLLGDLSCVVAAFAAPQYASSDPHYVPMRLKIPNRPPAPPNLNTRNNSNSITVSRAFGVRRWTFGAALPTTHD